jgi:uncharacterized protein with HEPN domain
MSARRRIGSPRSSRIAITPTISPTRYCAAVERQFQIIGEALNRLSQAAPELAARITDLRRAVGMRNVLIHAYRRVDDDAVWQTLQNLCR